MHGHVCGNVLHDIVVNTITFIQSFVNWSTSIRMLVELIRGLLSRTT